jgi:predicted HicB family RNase H-like nuclease
MNKYASHVTGSNVGAIAVGDQARAEGTVNVSTSITQAEHTAHIKAAQRALVNDQDALDRIDARLYEALGQFLRMAREIQVEQKSVAELQAKMKDTLDEVWAEQAARGLRPKVLSKTLEVAKALAENPLMAEVAKKLLEG